MVHSKTVFKGWCFHYASYKLSQTLIDRPFWGFFFSDFKISGVGKTPKSYYKMVVFI